MILSMDWEEQEQLHIIVSFEKDYSTCLKNIGQILSDPMKPCRSQTQHYSKLSKSIPKLSIPEYPVAGEMARTIPLFVDAMKVNETKTMATNRAAT
ncbi:MAG: hypothetical protein HQL31_13685, partial [Planctomycetes bacterium]|nr:hypothetical protein [Planctomycetota bacterium]